MSKLKKVAVLLIVLFVALMVFAFLAGSVINLFVPPSYAVYGDKVVEDIGGDNALVATLSSCVEVGRTDIADGSFKTALGQDLGWKNAKTLAMSIPPVGRVTLLYGRIPHRITPAFQAMAV